MIQNVLLSKCEYTNQDLKKSTNIEADVISKYLRDMHELPPKTSGNQLDFKKLLHCIYTEITLPSVRQIRKVGFTQFFTHFFKDIFESFIALPNTMATHFSERRQKEDKILINRLHKCTNYEFLTSEMFKTGPRSGSSYGYDPLLGFILLGLKVVGVLFAYMYLQLRLGR